MARKTTERNLDCHKCIEPNNECQRASGARRWGRPEENIRRRGNPHPSTPMYFFRACPVSRILRQALWQPQGVAQDATLGKLEGAKDRGTRARLRRASAGKQNPSTHICQFQKIARDFGRQDPRLETSRDGTNSAPLSAGGTSAF